MIFISLLGVLTAVFFVDNIRDEIEEYNAPDVTTPKITIKQICKYLKLKNLKVNIKTCLDYV